MLRPMGRWRRVRDWWMGTEPAHTYDSAPRPIDQVILEMVGRGAAPRVTRTEALSVPAVQRGRNMICSIATLPLIQYGPKREVAPNPLLAQIDPDVANVVTLAQTLEDLLFEGISWWRITAFGWDGFPVYARHLDVTAVSLTPPTRVGTPAPLPSGWDPREAVVYVDGLKVPASEIIRFDSPNPAILHVGGRAIKRAILLDQAASMYADDPRPLDYFTPAEGADETTDDEIAGILAKWKASRKKRATAYVPAAIKYNSVDTPSPLDLQLVELQQRAALDLANEIGIDPEDLGISTTSRTYANAVDRRRDRINDVLAPYMRAVTDRLSMGDVTKRGYCVEFYLDDYMKSNPTERWATYKTAEEIGVMDAEEIRAKEGLPVRAPSRTPPPVVDDPAADPAPATDPVGADASAELVGLTLNDERSTLTLSDEPELRTFDLPMVSFSVNKASRTITGLALPYGVTGSKYGLKFQFIKGALKWKAGAVSRIKLLRDHDMRQPLGYATKITDGPNGLAASFKVASGPEGDRALALADEKVLDGLSVGVDFDLAADVEMDQTDPELMLVKRADLREVSLTAMPLFDDARVSKVDASRSKGDNSMPCSTCGQVHAESVACTAPPTDPQPAQPAGLALNSDQLALLLSQPGALQSLLQRPQPAAPATPPGSLTLSREQLDALIASGGLGTLLGVPSVTPAPQPAPEKRQVVDPTRKTTATVSASVTEPMPYRFDAAGNLTKGVTYDFSTDLVMGSRGDGEAMQRATEFMRSQFARVHADVDKADALTLNPNIQRPDMYVDQKEFQTPIWDTINKGTIADATPFVLPKFSSSSGLVAAHVEGVSPTPGTFVATSQTITPTPVSGRVEITREAWDQGGNPQLSGLIWRQMTRAWYEALEASAVVALDALTPTGITLTTAAQDDVLVNQLEAALAALQFIRGGFRMREFFVQVDLYQALIAAADADGRKLLPRLNPVNSSGQVSDFYGDVVVGGLRGQPSWALAATGTVAASSYLFDRGDMSGWATTPQRLEFQYRVEYVDVAIWGYKALANTDLTGVREVIYDPA